jgi:hypothetical protein
MPVIAKKYGWFCAGYKSVFAQEFSASLGISKHSLPSLK